VICPQKYDDIIQRVPYEKYLKRGIAFNIEILYPNLEIFIDHLVGTGEVIVRPWF
jgi:hypothetical protein